jgi:hypothetical protein
MKKMGELNNYDPNYINVKVSLAAMFERLQALDTVADNPAKVKAWGERVWKELGNCEVVIFSLPCKITPDERPAAPEGGAA